MRDTGARLRLVQLIAATLTVGLIILARTQSWWPFDNAVKSITSIASPSVWQFLFSDVTVLGFVHLALVALAFFIVVSIPALVLAGRWLRGVGTSGLSTDNAVDSLQDLTTRLRAAEAQIEQLTKERDEALKVGEELSND